MKNKTKKGIIVTVTGPTIKECRFFLSQRACNSFLKTCKMYHKNLEIDIHTTILN